MIAFDFEYYNPDTVEEAVELFKKLDSGGKNLSIMEEVRNLLVWQG